MSKPTVYGTSITFRCTPQIRALLLTELQPGQDLSDLMRDIARQHLDESEQIRGNRRSQRQIVQQETERIRWYLVLIVTLIANIGSFLILSLLKIPEDSKDLFSTSGLLAHAQEETTQYGWRIIERIDTAIDEAHALRLHQLDDGKR